MIDATAIIMTKNEEKNICAALDSMKGFAKRCVVIDCGSTDSTVKLATDNGADVFFHEFEYYAKQFNWGIENCHITTEWIIRLDADEVFPADLKKEIETIIANNNDDLSGIVVEARLFFMGKYLKHGGPMKRKMMLFKREFGRIEDRRRDAHSIVSQGRVLKTKHKFLHHDFKDLDTFIKRYNWYATREAMDFIEYKSGKANNKTFDKKIEHNRKRKFGLYYKFPSFFRAWIAFIHIYFFKLGFLDGKAGLMFSFFNTYWYRFLVDAKIYEYEKMNKKFERLKDCD